MHTIKTYSKIILVVMLLLVASQPAQAQAVVTVERVSIATSGVQSTDASYDPSVSSTGRYVSFTSAAANLVAGDTNGYEDIFVHDRQTGITERVSVASDGTQANHHSEASVISGDGRYVAFQSDASNLVTGDTNNAIDIFVHDRQTGITKRVSVASDGTQANTSSENVHISLDGRFITFWSSANNLVPGDTNNRSDIFIHNLENGTTERISMGIGGAEANDSSYDPCLSADGRYVAFRSAATNLVSGDTNGVNDVFVHDRQTGTTALVSVATGGALGNQDSRVPAVSADGQIVVFQSMATNLAAGDTNGTWDIFLHDRQTGITTLLSAASDGTVGNQSSTRPSLSADGQTVVFESRASNLVPTDTNGYVDVFLWEGGVLSRVSTAADGTQADNGSGQGQISGDGQNVVFSSEAENLIPDDTNLVEDIFIYSSSYSLFLPLILK
jgi:Tol biopolymer transport system component